MTTEHGEIIIYQSDDGQSSLEVQLEDETVWLSQAQLVELFDRNKRTISEHIRNVFKEGELVENSVVRKYRTAASDGKFYDVTYYNLDAEKGFSEMKQAIALLSKTLERHESLSDEGRAVLEVVNNYAKSWSLLLKYDEDRLELPKDRHTAKTSLDYGHVKEAIVSLKAELMGRGEASDLFGQERAQHLQGILGNIDQTFGGQDLYPSIEEKAAHLLYFVIKDHPFSDGNKRIGSFLFLIFLKENNLLDQSGVNDNGLVALALLIAESDPKQKDLMIRLVVNLLAGK